MITGSCGTTIQRQRQDGGEIDPVSAAEIILRRFGPRAVTMLSAPRADQGDAQAHGRISANDCYVALDEACRKMARVAVRRYRQASGVRGITFDAALGRLFPDPHAYLARAVRSVISDEGRAARREPIADSLDRPIGDDQGHALLLGDTVAEDHTERLPEATLIERDERSAFRAALQKAIHSVPANYVGALCRDIDREKRRQAGAGVERTTANERQTLHRARAALAAILRKECGDDNPYVGLLAQRRNAHVPTKRQPAADWSGERRDTLFRRLLESPWAERTHSADGAVDEAIVNDVTHANGGAPPSPEMRQAMRVLDLYTVDRVVPATEQAATHYERARTHREAGRLEEALAAYKACHTAEPSFIEALNEVGVMYSRLGRLRDALRVYLGIIERDPRGDHKYIAATNAADIYLTWYDTGRNRAHNIELAIQYARMAMERPTPMRACNLVQALAKDRYYAEARDVVADILTGRHTRCAPERFLQTMFQIRDPDLVDWWTWLETELDMERR